MDFTDLHVVEGQVDVHRRALDEPVVSDDRDVGLVGLVDGLGHHVGVVGDDDEHLDPAADERFAVLDLAHVVAVGALHEHFAAEFADLLDEHVAIRLPAFFLEGV